MAWFLWLRPNPHRPMFAMGWSKALLKDFTELCILAEKKLICALNYFKFFNLLQTRLPRNWWDRAPLTCPSSCASYFISPLTRPRVFGWLLCKIVAQQPPKAKVSFILFKFLSPQLHPNRSQYTPPCNPRRSLVLSCPSLVAPAFFWLVVVCSLSPGGGSRPWRILFFHFFVD